jgi:acetylornithine/succinyldiaminopimelate/putrescine aminotransferase
MAAVSHTWISSTLATEFVALAAAKATLKVMVEREVPEHLRRVGRRLLNGLTALRHQYPDLVSGVGGVSEMCFLQYTDEAVSREVTTACALAGLLFKRSAYNFVSLAHTDAVVDHSLELIAEALSAVGKPA